MDTMLSLLVLGFIVYFFGPMALNRNRIIAQMDWEDKYLTKEERAFARDRRIQEYNKKFHGGGS